MEGLRMAPDSLDRRKINGFAGSERMTRTAI